MQILASLKEAVCGWTAGWDSLDISWMRLSNCCVSLTEKRILKLHGSGAGSINHWVLVESVSNSQIRTLDLAPATVWKRVCIDLCSLDDTIINILCYTVTTVTPLLLSLLQRLPSTLHLGLLLKWPFWTQTPSLKKEKCLTGAGL